MEERLRKFAQLVDAGSFTKAARELHVSQPALSIAVAKLERELKSHLYVRGARPMSLTPAGQLTYKAAKDLAVHTDNLRLRLAELSREKVTLKIGMIDSVAEALFENGSGLEMLENAKVSVVVNNSRYLTEAVERGVLDIAFTAEQSGRPSSLLQAKPLATEPLVVVAHASRSSLHPGKLPDFISYDQLSNTFRLVQRALRDYGVTTDTILYSTSPEVMLRLALLNKGIAVLPYLLVRQHLVSAELQRLDLPVIARPIIVLQRRDKELPFRLKQLTSRIAGMLDTLMEQALSTRKSVL